MKLSSYNSQGELWFIHQMRWTGHNCFDLPPGEPEKLSTHEFRNVGRAMRMTRQRDPEFYHAVVDGTNVWYDYDGDEIYAETQMDYFQASPFTFTPLAAHEPGIGSFDYAANAASYRHGDQIGSTRAVTGEPNGGPAPVEGRIVYTAFGERVWSDGTVGTRYQYAGAWGYQSGLYEDASGNLPFVHVGHRWYDPATGRFLQRDPIGIRGDLNTYEYAGSSPNQFIDPLGLDRWITGNPGLGEHWTLTVEYCGVYVSADFSSTAWDNRGPGTWNELKAAARALSGSGGKVTITTSSNPPSRNIICHQKTSREQDRQLLVWMFDQQRNPPGYSARYNCQTFVQDGVKIGLPKNPWWCP